MTKKGLFITFEGIEGCGKSTQIKLLADFLKKEGSQVLLTREPGGTSIGDKIREILLDPENAGMSARCELLLYSASRHQHVSEKIIPSLKKGMVVLSDRFFDATQAYQGAARKLSGDLVEECRRIATEGIDPDLTFILDLPAKEGLNRISSRYDKDGGGADRLESEDIGFHERVREGYLQIAKREPKRVVVIDAKKTVDEIHEEIVKKLSLIGY
ncbi:MAG: dTMP kinase [Pseudomonadota bacterium]